MDKYVKMAWKIGASSFIDQLVTSTNLQYSVEILAMPMLSKFKIPQVKMYDRSDQASRNVQSSYGFPNEIAC